MTVYQIIQEVKQAGGSLHQNGDHLVARLRRNKNYLRDLLRDRRDEVLEVLRRPVRDSVNRWIAAKCVGIRGARSNAKVLHREYLVYCRAYGICWDDTVAVCNGAKYDDFLWALEAKGVPVDADGMLEGLCLTTDFTAAWELEKERVLSERLWP